MSQLLNRLLILLNDLDPNSTFYHIAYTMLTHFSELQDMNINEISMLCNVAKSTISKFIREIGFEDFSDFKASVKFHEERYKLNYNLNIAKSIENLNFEEYAYSIQNDIQALVKTVDMDCIDELVKDIKTYRIVGAFGSMFSQFGAMDLQAKLAYNGKFIITFMDDIKQEEFIKSSCLDTLIIIYSNSGDFIIKSAMSEFQTAKDYSKVKAKIVLITSNLEMTKHPKVDLCILIPHTSRFQTHSFLFPLINDIIVAKLRSINND